MEPGHRIPSTGMNAGGGYGLRTDYCAEHGLIVRAGVILASKCHVHTAALYVLQAWAEMLAKNNSCGLYHSSIGENLAASWGSASNVANCTRASVWWYGEVCCTGAQVGAAYVRCVGRGGCWV